MNQNLRLMEFLLRPVAKTVAKWKSPLLGDCNLRVQVASDLYVSPTSQRLPPEPLHRPALRRFRESSIVADWLEFR